MTAPLKKTVLRRYTATLTAGSIINFEAYGDYVFLLSNSGTDATLKIAFDNNEEVALATGLILKLSEPFNRIFVRNTDSASATFVILCGQGEIDYKALVLSGTITTGPAQSSTGTFAADVTAGAAAKVFTAATVKNIIIQNKAASGGPVYLGLDNTVSATKSFYELLPGAAFETQNFKGDIWLFGPLSTEKVSVSSW